MILVVPLQFRTLQNAPIPAVAAEEPPFSGIQNLPSCRSLPTLSPLGLQGWSCFFLPVDPTLEPPGG